jgi:CheY-like chemotaxis protein
MHDRTVAAFSEGTGKGSEFVVRLPVAAAPAKEGPETGPAGDGTHPAARRRALVVDDNVDAAESMAALLQLPHQEVRVVHDGPSAVATVGDFRPDVILLDIGLPGMSGYEVAQRIREMPEFRDVQIVAMTGYGQEEDRRRSREAGFDDHLVKPVDFQTLQKLLWTKEAAQQGGPASA